MSDIRDLLRYRSFEQLVILLQEAVKIVEENQNANWYDFQKRLHLGTVEAYIIHDWLADNYHINPRISRHWIHCGRLYVKNNPSPSLGEMMQRIRIGRRSAFQIMLELEKRGIIKILLDFTFEKRISSTEEDFIKQLKWAAKKYRGRCEPELLMRVLYLGEEKANQLSQYGAKELGLRPKKWRNR